ncbi:hypothetical protein BHE74_00053632 [Ensete ventricosum]|nr:hypothetical protein BHE74_00053632 [Ensete ventricosum]
MAGKLAVVHQEDYPTGDGLESMEKRRVRWFSDLEFHCGHVDAKVVERLVCPRNEESPPKIWLLVAHGRRKAERRRAPALCEQDACGHRPSSTKAKRGRLGFDTAYPPRFADSGSLPHQ